MTSTTVLGTGHYVPPKVLTNHDLEKIMDTSDEWIRQRTGIEQRYVSEQGVGPSDLALEASREAIRNAGLEPDDIDFIIFATFTPDHYFPGSGVFLGRNIKYRVRHGFFQGVGFGLYFRVQSRTNIQVFPEFFPCRGYQRRSV